MDLIGLRLAWREIRNNRRFSLFFALNLMLGLMGFVALDAFKASFQQSLESRSRAILGADLAVSSRRGVSEDELKTIRATLGPGVQETRVLEIYSMVAGGANSRLTELVAVEAGYPFYGQLKLSSGVAVQGGPEKEIAREASVWIYPELAVQLGVGAGDKLKIGNREFTVAAMVQEDSGNGARGFSLAPRAFIDRARLLETGLVQKGSTVTYRWLYRIPAHLDADELVKTLETKIEDPGVQIVSHRSASDQMGRMIGYLNDYLGLVSLVTLFLAALGASFLFRSFLSRRLKEIAVLMSLGVDALRAQGIYVLQLSLLGLASAVLACVSAEILLPLLGKTLEPFLPFPVQPRIRWASAGIGLLMGVASSVLICLPLLMRIRRLRPAELFQEDAQPALDGSWKGALGFVPAILVFWLLSVWQSKSWWMGSVFVGAFFASGLAMMGAATFGLESLGRISAGLDLRRKIAVRNLVRHRASTISCFLALGLGALLVSLIPQIQENLETELTQPEVSQVPSLFLFDIQEEQAAELSAFLASKRIGMTNLTPLVRARLESVNGKAFEKILEGKKGFSTREAEREARSRNRGYNLTYRAEFSEAESLEAGRLFSGKPRDPADSSPAEISVEFRFAERLGLKLGDELVFDIQGVKVPGRIVNLRRVKWTSFQPNFFIVFQPGVLEEAPKTYLASVPKLQPGDRARIQTEIVARFPNVSIVDIHQVVEKLLSMFLQMGWAIRFMAYLSLFAGFAVLYSIATQQVRARRSESHLLKVLGASFEDVQGVYLLEFTVLGASASLLGAALSLIVSYGISVLMFDGIWVFAWQVPVTAIALVTALSSVTAWFATRGTLRRKSIELLQGSTG